MLFKTAVQKQIRDGEVTIAFRRWSKPRVKAGTSHKSGFGMIAIGTVDPIAEETVTDDDARRAGYASKADLLADLANRDGDLYRIELAHGGVDPRVALREDDDLSDDAYSDIRKRIDRLDKASRRGSWTRAVLEIISEHPGRRAGDLADLLGHEKDWLKLNVRKLKNLGLTISGEVGYTISPRGSKVLARLKKEPT